MGRSPTSSPSGAEARLPRELKGAAATAAENHRNRDVLIEDAIENLQPGVAGTLAEIAAKVGLVPAVLSMRDSNGWRRRSKPSTTECHAEQSPGRGFPGGNRPPYDSRKLDVYRVLPLSATLVLTRQVCVSVLPL